MSERASLATTSQLLPRQRTSSRPTSTETAGAPRVLDQVVPQDRIRLLFGLPVAAIRMGDVVDLATIAVHQRTRLAIGALNAAKVVKLGRDPALRDSLLASDLMLADGQSLVWASQLLGRPVPERVAGIDVFQRLLDVADRDRLRVYLLGAKQQILDDLLAVVAERWPHVVVAGSHDGYFEDAEAGAVAAEIAASRADMLFVAMTTPRKELFLSEHGPRTRVPVIHGVGGSFDVVAGHVRRAPLRWQQLGLEWAYRLLREPRRLWRRYLFTNTAFLGLLLREKAHQRPPYAQRTTPLGGVRHG